MRKSRIPKLTAEDVRAALAAAAPGAEELRKTLEQEHLRGLSKSLAMRLD
jgi:hypothetical protein